MSEASVTVVVTRRVKAGHEVAYEAALQRVTEGAHALPGYLGTTIQRPAAGGARDYTSVIRWADVASLRAFEASALRADFLAAVQPHVEADATWRELTGLEFWFAPPPGTVIPQPSPARMALLLIAVVWSLVLVIGGAVNVLVGDALPYPLRLLLTIVLEVLLMTYVLMPRLTRWLAPWIYPKRRAATG